MDIKKAKKYILALFFFAVIAIAVIAVFYFTNSQKAIKELFPANIYNSLETNKNGQDNVIRVLKVFKLDENKNPVEDITEKIKAKDDNWATVNGGQYIRVVFERPLNSANDITIYAREAKPASEAGLASLEVYAENSAELVATFPEIKQARSYKIYLNKLKIPTDTFDLKINCGMSETPQGRPHKETPQSCGGGERVEIDWVTDPTEGGISITGGIKINSGIQMSSPVASWYDSNWSSRKKITIQTANVDADLTDFPLYVKISADGDMTEAQADGDDIRFTNSDGETLLKYEEESWTGGGGAAVTANFWVKSAVTTAGTGATDIYIYYGNADAADGQDAANVWDANYKAVWHLTNLTDSTVNGHTMTAYNTPTAGATGKVGNCYSFDRASSEYLADTPQIFDAPPYTLEAWFYTVDSTNYQAIFSNWKGISDVNYVAIDIHMGLAAGPFEITSVYSSGVRARTQPCTANAWHYGVGTQLTTSNRVAILDADFANKDTNTEERLMSGQTGVSIGAIADLTPGSYFDGSIDEVRVSNIVRSDAWIKFGYNNIFEADNELTWDAEELP